LKSCLVLVFLLLMVFSGSGSVEAGVFFGGSHEIGSEETFRGDLVIFGSNADIHGVLQGDLVIFGGEAEINGEVTGNIVSIGSRINLQKGSRVDGELISVGGSLSRGENVYIGGQTRLIEQSLRLRNFRGLMLPPQVTTWGSVLSFFYQLFFVLIITFFFPRNVRGTGESVSREWGVSILVGFVAFLIFLPLILFFLFTILGIPLALLLGLVYYFGSVLGLVAIFYLLGKRVLEKMGYMEKEKIMGTAIIGLFILFLARLLIRIIPLVGGPLHFVITVLLYMLALGAVLKSRFGTRKSWIRQE